MDWEAFGDAFNHLQKGEQISFSKLTHGLLNTNSQNSKFYGKSGLCPCCSIHHETITHMLTCPNTDAVTYRNSMWQMLLTKLKALDTHRSILDCFEYGLSNWTGNHTSDMHAPTRGSVKPLDTLLTQAFNDQCDIGWEQFLRGRISIYWRRAYGQSFQNSRHPGRHTDKAWSSALIKLLLMYSRLVWKYRNGIIYGHNKIEEHNKKLESMQAEISKAFESYKADKFIISRHLSSLFDKPLQYVLNSDMDFLQNWLHTYKEAVSTQQMLHQQQSLAAQTFFQPRRRVHQNPPTAGPCLILPATPSFDTFTPDSDEIMDPK